MFRSVCRLPQPFSPGRGDLRQLSWWMALALLALVALAWQAAGRLHAADGPTPPTAPAADRGATTPSPLPPPPEPPRSQASSPGQPTAQPVQGGGSPRPAPAPVAQAVQTMTLEERGNTVLMPGLPAPRRFQFKIAP